ncbi:unnamed protein product [Effrenium voratum]|nr:unnamed protein product [Effrenium voratum]
MAAKFERTHVNDEFVFGDAIPHCKKWTRVGTGNNDKVDQRLDLFLSLMGMPLSLFKYTFDSEDPAGELILYRHCHGSFSRVLMRRVRGDVVASLEVNPPSATIRFAGSGNEIATIPYLLHGPPTFAQVARDVRGNSMTESQGIQLLLGTSSTRPVPSTRLWTAHGAMLAREGVVQPALERVDDDSDSSSQTLSWRRMGQLHGPAPKAESKGAAAKRPAAKQIAAKRPAAKRIAAKRPAAKKGIAAKRPAAKVAR